MEQEQKMRAIAHIESDFPEKFGIPRQSGLVPELEARIVFEPEFRKPDMLRGLEEFSHIWLIWRFSADSGERAAATVRPPKLGGNRRMGVFATRSPHRPNPIALSCVKIKKIDTEAAGGPFIYVCGADLMDGSAIYDIKPYLPYADRIEDAKGGFSTAGERLIEVDFPPALFAKVPEDKRKALVSLLEQDPRPGYHAEEGRTYGMSFASLNVRFSVSGGVLKVSAVEG